MKRMSHEEFLCRLLQVNEYYASGFFEITGVFKGVNKKIEVRDSYGVGSMYVSTLLRGGKPSIMSASNKSEYCVNEFKDKRDFVYDYSLVKYRSQKDPVEIICEDHGVFKQTPDVHKKGHGCSRCDVEGRMIKRHDIDEYLRSTYPEEVTILPETIKGAATLVTFICKYGHSYQQTISGKRTGYGCITCSNISKAVKDSNKDKAFLYCGRVSKKGKYFYKVGVTTRPLHQRKSELLKVLDSVEIKDHVDLPIVAAFTLEALIPKLYSEFKMILPKFRGGHTECYTENVLRFLLPELHETFKKH